MRVRKNAFRGCARAFLFGYGFGQFEQTPEPARQAGAILSDVERAADSGDFGKKSDQPTVPMCQLGGIEGESAQMGLHGELAVNKRRVGLIPAQMPGAGQRRDQNIAAPAERYDTLRRINRDRIHVKKSPSSG